MDDAQPRYAEGGAPAPLPALRQVTLLADADESAETAVEDWSRGLDWVHWLFSSIRQRQQGIYFQPSVPQASAKDSVYPPVRAARKLLNEGWDSFLESTLAGGDLGRVLVRAWQAAQSRQMEALLALDAELSTLLAPEVVRSSIQAGERLLHGTRGARYQGLLGRYRQAQENGQTPGHFFLVWACVSHFFQLSLASMVAEYVRLEWDLAVRQLPGGGAALAGDEIAVITARLMRGLPEVGPRLLAAADDAASVAGDPSSEAESNSGSEAVDQRHLGR